MAVIDANDSNFDDLIKSHDKVVVKFFAGWCGSCRLFAPKYKRLSADERFTAIYFLDVNAEENPVTRQKVGVATLPFFAVFQKGELIETLSTSKEEAFIDLLTKLN